MRKITSWLVFAPFVALLVIVVTGLFGYATGVFEPGPSNGFAIFGVATTLVGLIVGIVAVVTSDGRWGALRWLIALLYVPVAIVSFLLIGL